MEIINTLIIKSLLPALVWLAGYVFLHRKEDVFTRDTGLNLAFGLVLSSLVAVYHINTSNYSYLIPQCLTPFLIIGLVIVGSFERLSKKGIYFFAFFWVMTIYLPLTILLKFFFPGIEQYSIRWFILNEVAGFSALAIILFSPPARELRQFKLAKFFHFIWPIVFLISIATLHSNFNVLFWASAGIVYAFLMIWHGFYKKIPSFLPAASMSFLLIFLPFQQETHHFLLMPLSVALAVVFLILLNNLHPRQVDLAFWIFAVHGVSGYLAMMIYTMLSDVINKFLLLLIIHAFLTWSLMISYVILSVINRISQARL